MNRYFIIYKPYQVLSQFSPVAGKKTLADFFRVPRNVYPVGRLDEDSEGLLLLTDDEKINQRLLHPDFEHEREYWVQVEGKITTDKLKQMEAGVEISVNGHRYTTKPCSTELLSEPVKLPDRYPPVRYRKTIPTTWIRMILREGKNRQVRKMTASVGFPTLRLVRYRVEDLQLDSLMPGEMKEMSKNTVYKKLFRE